MHLFQALLIFLLRQLPNGSRCHKRGVLTDIWLDAHGSLLGASLGMCQSDARKLRCLSSARGNKSGQRAGSRIVRQLSGTCHSGLRQHALEWQAYAKQVSTEIRISDWLYCCVTNKVDLSAI